MATRKAAKTKSVIVQTLQIKQVNRTNVDIKKWRDAHKAAESESENRLTLYDLYDDIGLDGHLGSVIDKRINAITNMDLVFNDKSGKENPDITALIGTEAFHDLITGIISVKVFGHTVLELLPSENGFTVTTIDRRHVKPRKGIVVAKSSDTTGINFRDELYSKFIVEIGKNGDYGLMLKAVPYAIFKRNGWNDWADFCQLFGIPFRKATYDNDETRKILEEAMAKVGSAGYIVAPKDANIELVRAEGASANSTVFENFKDACNEEMSVIMLGQSMTTTEATTGGYAQGLVHQAVEAGLFNTDKKYLIRVLNSKVIPVLINLGYKVEGGSFSIAESDTMPLTERIKVDTEVVKLVPVDKDYFYKKYGIPAPVTKDVVGGVQPVITQPQSKQADKLTDISEHELTLFDRLIRFFVPASLRLAAISNSTLIDRQEIGVMDEYKRWTKAMKKILGSGINPSELNVDLFWYTAKTMQAGATKSGLNLVGDIAYDNPDYTMLSRMQSNTFFFAGAKTYQQLYDINQALYDENGNIKPFSKFRREIIAKVEGIDKTYNETWLETEYNHAIISSQQAAIWARAQDNTDMFPNLKYVTVGDERVRQSHKALDGIIRPINDPFWDTHYPPLDWNCRCTVEPTVEGEHGDEPEIIIPNQFKNNVGKTGELFYKHPFYERNGIDMASVVKTYTGFVDKVKIDHNQMVFKTLLKNGFIQIEEVNNKGGFVMAEKGVDVKNITPEELQAANLLAGYGNRVVFKMPINAKYTLNSDIQLNEVDFEIKTVGTNSNIKSRIEEDCRDAVNQARNLVLQLDTDKFNEIARGLGNIKDIGDLLIIILNRGKKTVITVKDIRMGNYAPLDALK